MALPTFPEDFHAVCNSPLSQSEPWRAIPYGSNPPISHITYRKASRTVTLFGCSQVGLGALHGFCYIPKGWCWFFFFFFSRALQSINPTDYSALFCFTDPLQSDIPVNNKLLMNQTSTELVSPSCFVPRQSKSLSDLVWWEKLVTHSAPIDKQFRNEGQDKKLPKKTWLKMTGPTPKNAAPWLPQLFRF